MLFRVMRPRPEGGDPGGKPDDKKGEEKKEPVILTDDIKKKISEDAVTAFKQSLKAPEKYEGLKTAENSLLPAGVLDRATAHARKVGYLSNEHAQGLLEFAEGEVKQAIEKTIADFSPGGAQFEKQKKDWETASLNAADIGGGDPAKLQAHVARVNTVVQKYFPEDVRKLFNDLGIGSHPGFFRAIAKLAEAAKEEGFVTGAPPSRGPKTAAERLYGGTMGKKEATA